MFHKKMKDGAYWVWGSEAKARDFLPRYKCKDREELKATYRKHGLMLKD